MNRALVFLGSSLVLLAGAHLLLPWSDLAALHAADPETARLVLLELRLPRTLLALGYGAVLGITGAALQAYFANPLASPDITGASSGAALGAVIGAYWLGVSSPLGIAACGIAGALILLALLLALAGRPADRATLLLAGLALAMAAGAATSLALALAPSPFAFYDAFSWLMGNFADRSLPQAAAALIPAGLASAFLVARTRSLDLLALGEDVSASLGVDPRRLGRSVVILSSVAIGSCVAVCGAVGFIGLIAPYLARRITRGHPGRAMVPAGLIGASLVLAADLALRLAPAGRTIPIGVLTTVLGTPLFIWLVVTMRQKVTS